MAGHFFRRVEYRNTQRILPLRIVLSRPNLKDAKISLKMIKHLDRRGNNACYSVPEQQQEKGRKTLKPDNIED